MKKAIIIEIICFLFIVLFVYAAGSKLIDIENFRVQIGRSPLLTNTASFAAWFIPSVEIITAIFLAFKRTKLVGLFSSFSLMVMFTAYIIALLKFDENIPCSCGGVLSSLNWTEHLIFNIGFVLLGLLGIILQTKFSNSINGKLVEKKSVITT